YDEGSGANIAYTSINVRVETLVSKLRQVFADLENIYVLYARNNESAVQTQLRPLEDYADDPAQNLNIGEIPVENASTAVDDLRDRVPVAVAEILARDPEGRKSIFWITGSTSVYNHIGLINELAGDIPVLAALPDVVKPGAESAVLSIGVNQSTAVHLSALYAIRVLEGSAEVGSLPVGQVSPPDIAINFMKVDEMGLTLPFTFFEDATFIYDRFGRTAREFGQRVPVN
ncbi:MAG: ABC transporter substrate binding protein, partial [Pseudomonadota bacterium]